MGKGGKNVAEAQFMVEYNTLIVYASSKFLQIALPISGPRSGWMPMEGSLFWLHVILLFIVLHIKTMDFWMSISH